MPFLQCNIVNSISGRNKLFHLPVVVKLEPFDFLRFFRSSFHALLQLKSTKSGYSFNSYYLYVKCLLWADVDRVYVTVGTENGPAL